MKCQSAESMAVGAVRIKNVTETVTTIAVSLVADLGKSLIGGFCRITLTFGSYEFKHNCKVGDEH